MLAAGLLAAALVTGPPSPTANIEKPVQPWGSTSPCCRTPPSVASWHPQFPKPPPPGDRISSADFDGALRYIRASTHGARVRVEVHGPSFQGEVDEAEHGYANAVVRNLIRQGVPPGSIDVVKKINRGGGERRWISISVDRLGEIEARPER